MPARPGPRCVPRQRFRRTVFPTAATALATVLLASGCGGSGDDGDVQLRFSWWGSDERHSNLQQVIDDFEAENPGIEIAGEYSDWEAYWDRTATSTAANDAPDVIMQDELYLLDYGERGALLDLNEVEELDQSDLDPLVAESGQADGQTYGVPTGVTTPSLMANPAVFEDAGVDMPDDESWTWDELIEISAEITEATGGERYGLQGLGFDGSAFQLFARQHAENLYGEDGGLAFSEGTLQEWYRMNEELGETGGQPSASEITELEGGPEMALPATEDGAMAYFWSSQLGAMSAAADGDIELLRLPGENEFERSGYYFKPAMFYSVSADSDHPEEAARFIDYLLNDTAASEIVQNDLGVPANLEVREHLVELQEGPEEQVTSFMLDLEDSIVDGNPPSPVGAGEAAAALEVIYQDLLFGEITPAEAAERHITEVEEILE